MATATQEKAAVKTVEKGAEKVIDGLEDIAVATPVAMNKWVVLAGGVLIGANIGIFFTKKYLEKKYSKLADEEIQAVRDIYYEKAVKLEESSGARRVSEAKRSAADIIAERGYVPPTAEDRRYTEAEQAAIDEANEAAARAERAAEIAEEIAETEVVVTNVFSPTIGEWDWEVEKTIREEGHDEVPYVLHRDEYIANESGYEQMVLTYFEGDDVLADSQDTPVDDQDAMVGLGNLAKFGHGSGDPNTVYVRNPELKIEVEIVHSAGRYDEQRRGIPIDPPRREDGRFAPRNDQSPPSGDPRKRRNRGG